MNIKCCVIKKKYKNHIRSDYVNNELGKISLTKIGFFMNKATPYVALFYFSSSNKRYMS